MSYIAGYTGWSTTVNKRILDSTTFTIGENATKSDELDSGGNRTRLKSEFSPDKFSVTMEFNWVDKDSNGKTELQRFYEWYKYEHKYGSVPFEFPKILYSPNTGIKYIDDENVPYQVEYYKINSAVEGSKSGNDIQIKMTWETVYAGVITYSEQELESSDVIIYPKNGYVDIFFSTLPSTIPTSNDISIEITDSSSTVQTENNTVIGLYFDESHTLRVYYPALSTEGIYTMALTLNLTINGTEVTITKSAQYEVSE